MIFFMNILAGFAQNGCYIIQIEISLDDANRLGPQFNIFWKSGKCCWLLVRWSKMAITYFGLQNYADGSITHHLKIYYFVYQISAQKYVEHINKKMEVRIQEGKGNIRIRFTTPEVVS
jgi:hypothetical protein